MIAGVVPKNVRVPALVRVKPGALGRMGIYLRRLGAEFPLLLHSDGLPSEYVGVVRESLGPVMPTYRIDAIERSALASLGNELRAEHRDTDMVVGLGGGKALDAAKVVAAEWGLPYVAAPTSLSNDGFSSPGASLLEFGRRFRINAGVPLGVVVDTEVCCAAPRRLWLSGVGDLMAKLTAVQDWKLAYHAIGEPVDDLAALLSDATVFQFLARPEADLDGMRLLATSLLLNGIAMEMAGSSRPASGSEHLLSHALDRVSTRDHLHGLQVGFSTYIASHLQARTQINRRDAPGPAIRQDAALEQVKRIGGVFNRIGFWEAIRREPIAREEFLAAVDLAPRLKEGFFTVLSTRNCRPEVEKLLDEDPCLAGCVD